MPDGPVGLPAPPNTPQRRRSGALRCARRGWAQHVGGGSTAPTRSVWLDQRAGYNPWALHTHSQGTCSRAGEPAQPVAAREGCASGLRAPGARQLALGRTKTRSAWPHWAIASLRRPGVLVGQPRAGQTPARTSLASAHRRKLAKGDRQSPPGTAAAARPACRPLPLLPCRRCAETSQPAAMPVGSISSSPDTVGVAGAAGWHTCGCPCMHAMHACSSAARRPLHACACRGLLPCC